MSVPESAAETLKEIAELKNPRDGWFGKVADAAEAPLQGVSSRVFDTPVGEKAEALVAKIAAALNDAAAWTVRRDAILKDYREHGHPVADLDAISALDLGEVRSVLKRLDLKYRVLSTVEGAATGAAGALAIAIDIPALVVLALRAINEYGTYFGCDVDRPAERYFSLMVLSVAATATDDARTKAFEEISAAGKALSLGEPTPNLTADEGLIDRLAEALAVRLSKGKLAQLIPIVGSVVGGGFNRAFLTEICHLAELLYAERWLVRKYGPEALVARTGS